MKNLLRVHEKISSRGVFDEMTRLGTKKETRAAVGKFKHSFKTGRNRKTKVKYAKH